MKNIFLRLLLRFHDRAKNTPYYHLDGYMQRYWLLGFRSPERNGDNPSWVFKQPKSNMLYRWLCRQVAVRAHTILRSDSDRHLHDHPAWSLSIVLGGGYWEVLRPTALARRRIAAYRHLLDICAENAPNEWGSEEIKSAQDFGIFWRGPGAIVLRKAITFHRLVLPRGKQAKSIWVTGKKSNEWGFLTPDGKIPWREYITVKNIPEKT